MLAYNARLHTCTGRQMHTDELRCLENTADVAYGTMNNTLLKKIGKKTKIV